MQIRALNPGVALTAKEEQVRGMKCAFAAGLLLLLASCAGAPTPAALAAGVRASTPPASAADQGLIDRYDEQALRSIFAELGYSVVDASVTASGKPFLSVEAGKTLAFVATGDGCEGKDALKICWGIQLSTVIGSAGGADLGEIQEKANRTLRPAKLFVGNAGLVYERYLVMDGGVSRENLKTNVSVYVEILQALLDQIPG
jgi:hypothetical protein